MSSLERRIEQLEEVRDDLLRRVEQLEEIVDDLCVGDDGFDIDDDDE